MSAAENAVVAIEELVVRGPYGPPVEVPAEATRLDGYLGAAGRDPRWSAT